MIRHNSATANTTYYGTTTILTRANNIATMRTSGGNSKTSYVTRTHVGRNGVDEDDDYDNDEEEEDAKEVPSAKYEVDVQQAQQVQDACPECMWVEYNRIPSETH